MVEYIGQNILKNPLSKQTRLLVDMHILREVFLQSTYKANATEQPREMTVIYIYIYIFLFFFLKIYRMSFGR